MVHKGLTVFKLSMHDSPHAVYSLGGDLRAQNCSIHEALLNRSELQVLDLGQCIQVSDEAFRDFCHKKLRRVCLASCYDVSQEVIIKVLRYNAKTLQHLDLSGCTNFRNGGLSFLLKELESLVSLDLTGCNAITSEPFIETKLNSSSLSSISLADCILLKDDAIIALFKAAPALNKCRLAGLKAYNKQGFF